MAKTAPKTARTLRNRHFVASPARAKSTATKKSRPPHQPAKRVTAADVTKASRAMDRKIERLGKRRRPAKKRKEEMPPAHLSVAEKDAPLAVIKTPREKAMFRLLLYHGLHASEIGLLDLTDYRRGPSLDVDRLRIRRLKGSVGGDTLLVNAAAAAIRIWLKVRGTAPGPLFPSRKHRPLSRYQIWKLMKRFCLAARIPPEKAHPHALKLTCATLLLSESA